MEGKTFLNGAKEVIFKSVLQAIPTYPMSLFRMPLGYVRISRKWHQIFDGDIRKRKRAYTGSLERNLADQKVKKAWDLQMWWHLIKQCWQNKHKEL